MKSPEMESFLEEFAQKTFGRSYHGNVCITCGSDKVSREDFRTPLDWKEFGLSHMCQDCIDKAFGMDEE
jgi:ribosomal protein L35AE/L33A